MSTAVLLCVLLSTSMVGGQTSTPLPLPNLSPSSPSSPAAARCVDIAPSLSSCRRLGYRQMRLPSLVDLDAVNTTVASVASALIDQCGDDGLVLTCSLLAPVCIDRPIWPCASLCRNVTASCRAASFDMAALIDCGSLPSDDHLCIGPNSTGRKTLQATFNAKQQQSPRRRFG